jgi:hypothetical protein
MSRPTVIRPACLGVKHPSEAQDQIFITVRRSWVCWCGAPSLTRERACRLQLLLVLASGVIHRSESCGIYDHIFSLRFETPTTWRARSPYLCPPWAGLPSYSRLRLAGLRWQHLNPPPRRVLIEVNSVGRVIFRRNRLNRKHRSPVDVGDVVSRVPLQRHCLPGAGPRGNTASRSSPIVAWHHRERDVFLCWACSHCYSDKLLTVP